MDAAEGSSSNRPGLENRPLLVTGLVAAVSVVLAVFFEWGYVAGDPLAYHDRMAEILGEGRIPYFDADYEHLPMVLVPMAAVWYVGGFLGPFFYRSLWVVGTSIALVLTAGAIRSFGREVGNPNLFGRWLIIAMPLVPVVLFRTEPWILLPVALGLVHVGRAQWSAASAWTFIGVMGKAWPAVLVIGGWLRGNYTRLLASAGAAALALVPVIMSGGFRSGRDFTGMHVETAGGASAALWTMLTGRDVPLAEAAGAIYVDVDWIWGLVGLVLAVPAIVVLATSLRRRISLARSVLVMGALVGVGLLISPLQSTQFLFWMTPFAAVSPSPATRRLMLFLGALGLVNLVAFESMVLSPGWWFTVAAVRNGGLALAVFKLAREATWDHAEHMGTRGQLASQ